jgi:hypothetical protein
MRKLAEKVSQGNSAAFFYQAAERKSIDFVED